MQLDATGFFVLCNKKAMRIVHGAQRRASSLPVRSLTGYPGLSVPHKIKHFFGVLCIWKSGEKLVKVFAKARERRQNPHPMLFLHKLVQIGFGIILRKRRCSL